MRVHNGCLVDEGVHQRLDGREGIGRPEHPRAELAGHGVIGEG